MAGKARDLPDYHLSDGAAHTVLQPGCVMEAETKGWTGRFERVSFDSGFHVHMGALDVREDSDITVTGTGGAVLTSVFSVTRGKARFKPVDHPAIPFLPRSALIWHNRDRTGDFLVPGRQRMEFFSVAAPPPVYLSLLDGKVPASIAPLLDQDGDRFVWRDVSMRPSLFRLICNAGQAGNVAQPMRRLRLEGIALQWLAELLDQLEGQPRALAPLGGAEKRCVREARARLIADLGQPPTVSATAVDVGLSLKRLLHGFKEMYGETPAQLLRRERLSLARRLIEDEHLSLKEVAWRVGYHHATNFISAFTAEHGVPPRRMERQRAAARARRVPAKRPPTA